MKDLFGLVHKMFGSELSKREKSRRLNDIFEGKYKDARYELPHGIEYLMGYSAQSIEQREHIIDLFTDQPPKGVIVMDFHPFYQHYRHSLYDKTAIRRFTYLVDRGIGCAQEINWQEPSGRSSSGQKIPKMLHGNPSKLAEHQGDKELKLYLQPIDRSFLICCEWDNLAVRLRDGFFYQQKPGVIPERQDILNKVFDVLYNGFSIPKESSKFTLEKVAILIKNSKRRRSVKKDLLMSRN